jgi:ABC-type transport system substrate-binding protein
LLKVGVKLEVRSVEWSLMQKRMDEKNFDAFTGAWTSSWDTDPFQMFHSSQADIPKGSNRVGFRNKEADKIMEQLRVTFPVEERQTLFRRLHRVLHEQQPYSFFSFTQRAFCWRRDVKNVVFAKDRPVTDARPWSVAARE